MKKTFRWKLAQKVEFLWWKRYLKNKDQQEYLVWKRNYWQDLLNKISTPHPLNDNMHILDAGCGPAGIFIVLEEYQVDAVDPLINKYEELEHFSFEKYLYVNFINETLEKYTPEKKYSLIFCMNAINHVKDIEQCFFNLQDWCVKNGFLVISIDTHNYSIFKNIFRMIPGDVLHPQQYDLKEYIELLEKYGFKVKEQLLLKEEFFFNHYVLVAQKQ